MQIGIALNIPADEARGDAEVIREHMALGDLAELLGFDSLFALEHHFTGYLLSPAPFQTLAYYAGRTRRIKLGTAVIVLPWYDPVRVAEQIVSSILCATADACLLLDEGARNRSSMVSVCLWRNPGRASSKPQK